ncbi:MAG: beta-N-acetylhexosaminidase [Kiritimatiellae bacterium]|nr:beta-N-acetylhexosaminidase [Kiritimatiellia bacterium]
MTVSLTGLILATSLIPMPKALDLHDGTVATGAVKIVERKDSTIASEGYRIKIDEKGVAISASDAAGAFYARVTLDQLVKDGHLPCCEIEDAPKFRWRGVMLDEGRHFFGKEAVKNLLDNMAKYKLNVFHWHLTEDQGWRIDIPQFPDLVRYGSLRPESASRLCRGGPDDYRGNGQKYGPYFYTKGDIKEILDYARARHITVVPEVEIPGHVRALLAAYPQFACRENLPRVPRLMNGVEYDVLCAGNDEAIRFMEKVYDELCDLFPGSYIHIGGDECPKERWKECPKCQSRIKKLGLKDEDELQAWVTRHFTDYLAKKGRRTIGWDEVLAGNPGKDTIVQNWRRSKYGTDAAQRGHDVIISPVWITYFSVPQGVEDDPFTYLSPKMRSSLSNVYAFDPLAQMPTDETKSRVLGAECCLWTECIWNEYDLAWKTWPRALAFAEAVWTQSESPRNYAEFLKRAAVHRKKLIKSKVNCAPLE